MPFYPYLEFGGSCRTAFTRYQEIFGGELFVMPMSDIPGEEGSEGADLVAHAALAFEGAVLMGSDAPPGTEVGPVQGMYSNYSTADPADAERVFAALAEGGEVEMAAEATFFSPMFGLCRDRFGVRWMVVADAPEQPAP